MRVLLIDDDAGFRRTLRYHIEIEWPGAVIDEHAPSPRERGPQAIRFDGADVVLLGHPIAGESGFALLKALRSRAGCPPILVFADPSDEWLAVDALKAGAESYFPKRELRHERLVAALAGARRAQGALAIREHARDADERAAAGGSSAFRPSPRYRFLERLHSTDLSTVHLAEDEASGARVVCKVVHHRSGPAGARLFERFLREYEAIAAVRHRHVVQIFDLGIADDHAYIVMEHCDAGSLADRLMQGSIRLDRAIDYARQIGAALEAIHAAAILHRDLKPGNVMFRSDGSLALIDFGLAKQLRLEASLTAAGQIFGTPHYMSPEQGHGGPADERSDLYALGCILFEMLTARKPFTAGTPMGVIYRHAHSPRPRLTAEHAALQPLLDRLWAVEPAERFASATEWLRALDERYPAEVPVGNVE